MKRLLILLFILFALLTFAVSAETPSEQTPAVVEAPTTPPQPVVDDEECLY
jgi:hypothetical protein